MNNKEIPLLPGLYYHIYNHANGKENLFSNRGNSLYFLELYAKKISPIVNTFAYCLMPNHIHFAIQVKTLECIEEEWAKEKSQKNPGETLEKPDSEILLTFLRQRWGRFFQSYAQAYNKQHNRMGSLFMPNFKRRLVNGETDLKNVIHYIHSNPVHHGFTKKLMDWEFSSIHAYWLEKQTKISREEGLSAFGGKSSFEDIHRNSLGLMDVMEF